MSVLLNTLKKDCKDWILSIKKAFVNEYDMQVKLAKYLTKTKNYDVVQMEYFVPAEMFEDENVEMPNRGRWEKKENFPWDKQMHLDIVVEKKGKFAAVELKYAAAIACKKKKRRVFGEAATEEYAVNTSRGAYNAVMYKYWKDVRRIEAVSDFEKVVGGVALIVSNDHLYWDKKDPELARAMFSTHDGRTVGGELLEWKGSGNMKKSYPAFYLDSKYLCRWEPKETKGPKANARTTGLPFRYMMTVVGK